MTLQFLTLLLAVYSATLAHATLSCLGRDDKPVPWFTLIKYPENVTTSARYAYLDSNLGSDFNMINGAHCDSTGEALPNTIQLINKIPVSDLNLLVFNDEPPGTWWNPIGGHAKGILAFDNNTQTGVYIIHSFPRFPNVSDDGYVYYTLPKNTYMYGQNAYCISLDAAGFKNILNNLPVEAPTAYYSSGLFDGLVLNSTSPVPHVITQFKLLNGDDQWFLTKNPNFTGFLYEDIVAPYFNVPLAVESWGRPYQNPACIPDVIQPTVNVKQIAFNSEDTWDHYSDHSKWAISLGGPGSANVACLCDMNRMDSQEVRGGSCLCTENPSLYEALYNIIVTIDQCQ